jgi:hypothetical protein
MGDGCLRIVAARWMKAQRHGRGSRRDGVMFPASTSGRHTLGQHALGQHALGQMHLAIKSYLVAGERYRLSPHGSNPRCFLRSFAWNAGFLPKSPESNRIDVNFLSLNPYDRRAFTLSLDDFVYQNCS